MKRKFDQPYRPKHLWIDPTEYLFLRVCQAKIRGHVSERGCASAFLSVIAVAVFGGYWFRGVPFLTYYLGMAIAVVLFAAWIGGMVAGYWPSRWSRTDRFEARVHTRYTEWEGHRDFSGDPGGEEHLRHIRLELPNGEQVDVVCSPQTYVLAAEGMEGLAIVRGSELVAFMPRRL